MPDYDQGAAGTGKRILGDQKQLNGGIRMKTLILYESTHHGNTKKLCDAIAAGEKDVTVGGWSGQDPVGRSTA